MKTFNSFFLKSQFINKFRCNFIKYKCSHLIELIKSEVTLILKIIQIENFRHHSHQQV